MKGSVRFAAMLFFVLFLGVSASAEMKLTAVCAGLPEESPSGKVLKFFAEKVKEHSGGALEIDPFFGAELGSLTACVEGMAQGTIDIADRAKNRRGAFRLSTA